VQQFILLQRCALIIYFSSDSGQLDGQIYLVVIYDCQGQILIPSSQRYLVFAHWNRFYARSNTRPRQRDLFGTMLDTDRFCLAWGTQQPLDSIAPRKKRASAKFSPLFHLPLGTSGALIGVQEVIFEKPYPFFDESVRQ